MMNSSTNSTLDGRCTLPVFTWYTNPFNVSMFVLYLLVIVTVLIGNILVCIAVVINPILRKNIASYFIVSLAISDIATACFSMPFDLEMFITFGRWYHSELMCVVWSKAYLITVPTSIWNLFILSVDRYKTLKNPWDKFRESPFMTKKRALALISAVWIFSMACALSPELGWKFRKGGNLLVFCAGTICTFNVAAVYQILSAVVNFYLPMIAMCFIYYKIYRIASTQFLTRPKSALLELKSDSPAVTPKAKSKTKKLAQTNHKDKTRNDSGASETNTRDHGHYNLAMAHDVDYANRNKMMSRTSTMMEEIDLPGENNSNRHSFNLQEKGHGIESVDRRSGEIEAVVSKANGKDDNDTQQRHMQLLPQKLDQHEKPPQLDLQQQLQVEKKHPQLEEQQQSQVAQVHHHHHHTLHHQNALVISGNDENDADDMKDDDANDGDDNDNSSKNDDKDCGSNCADNNGGVDNVAEESNTVNVENVDNDATCSPNSDFKDGNDATCSPNSDLKNVNGSSNQNLEPVPESVITVQSAENVNDTKLSANDETLTSGGNSARNEAKDGATHPNSANLVSVDNTKPLSSSPSDLYNIHKGANLPVKRMSEDVEGTTHVGVSHQMHQYLRQQVSDDRARYGSHASICTLQSNVPNYGKSTLNLATSNEALNSFGSMEDITKRHKIFVKNKKAARTIATIVGTFLACWLPLTTSSIIWNICIDRCILTKEARQNYIYIKSVFLFLGYLSSAINPFIYSYRNVQFRTSYRKMVRKLFPCLKTVVRPN